MLKTIFFFLKVKKPLGFLGMWGARPKSLSVNRCLSGINIMLGAFTAPGPFLVPNLNWVCLVAQENFFSNPPGRGN